MFLHRTPKLIQKIYPSLVWRKTTAQKKIYLTFDDGPIPEVTPWVLDELAIFNAKATFFCVGDNVRKHRDIFNKIINQGHSVGNHTYNHLNGWKTSTDEYIENVVLADEEIGKHLNSSLFRPPYGRITRSQIKELKTKQLVMWDVLTGDFSQTLDPEVILKKSVKCTTPGSIVVFHDHIKAFENLKFVLPRYLKFFFEKGYGFARL